MERPVRNLGCLGYGLPVPARPIVLVTVEAICLVTSAACAPSSTRTGRLSSADVTHFCDRAAVDLHLTPARRLASASWATAEDLAKTEQQQGRLALAAEWRQRPGDERLAVCTFVYVTPRDSAPSATPTLCPGGYYMLLGGATDLGTLAAVVDTKGRVTQMPVPALPAQEDSVC